MKIRSPIISVLGHVDHGKTTLLDYIRGSTVADREAGGITQHIGATEIPISTIKDICGNFISKLSIKDTIPGLFFIDTPGHAAFTSLRKRGGALADLAILIVDINEGFKPQTIEAINILKMYKTPFVVAANKIDKIFGWESHPGNSFTQSFQEQAPSVQQDLNQKLYELVGELHKLGFQSERFDRISSYASQISIIPVSASTGEGIIELNAMLLGLAQEYLTQQLEIHENAPAKGTVLEVKEETGLGMTIDTIIYDGVLRTNDEIVLMLKNEILTTNVRSILKPNPLEEMRDSKKRFQKVDEIVAAAGVKIAAPNLEDVVSGSPLRVINDEEDVKKEIEEHIARVAQTDPWLRENPPKVEWLLFWPPFNVPVDAPICKAISAAYQAALGKPIDVYGFAAVDDGAFLNLAGIPAVTIGPGNLYVAHAPNEFVYIDELVDAAKIYALSILDWCGY